jgi:pilus assembly protein FimV
MSVDFDFDLGSGDAAPADAPAAASAPAAAPAAGGVDFDFGSLSLELPDAGGDVAAGAAAMDDVSTKLDLAKAYQEMGDKDGARELLKEVLAEGSEAQKAEANALIASLG